MKIDTSIFVITTETHPPVTERIFNLFTMVHDEVVFALGAKVHEAAGTEEEKLAFLQRMVPRDALSCQIFSFPHSPGMVALPGTDLTGLPADLFERAYTQTGQVIDLFEPVLSLLNASETPLFCLTTVRNGRPINDDGPIYEGGSEEADRAYRHQVLLDKLARTSADLLRKTYLTQGKFALCLVADPTVGDPMNHKLVAVSEEQMTGRTPAEIRALELLSSYDPENEAVVFFAESNDACCIKMISNA